MMTVRVLVPDMAGFPESLMTIGTRNSFFCSRSNMRSDDTIEESHDLLLVQIEGLVK
jgi:hypothetical protein